jgi:hypothetical protein
MNPILWLITGFASYSLIRHVFMPRESTVFRNQRNIRKNGAISDLRYCSFSLKRQRRMVVPPEYAICRSRDNGVFPKSCHAGASQPKIYTAPISFKLIYFSIPVITWSSSGIRSNSTASFNLWVKKYPLDWGTSNHKFSGSDIKILLDRKKYNGSLLFTEKCNQN